MRLAEHSLHSYRLHYERPVRWSDIVEEAAPFVLLRLQSDTEAVGVAEITVKPTWCGVTARSLIAATEEAFLPLIATLAVPREFRLSASSKGETVRDRITERQTEKTLIENAFWQLHANHLGHHLW